MTQNFFEYRPFQDHFKNHLKKDVQINSAEESITPEKELTIEESNLKHFDESFLSKNLSLGNYEEILTSLDINAERPQFFLDKIEKIKKTPGLEMATFLSEKDWEMLALIETKDRKTFEHSIGTFLIAKDKIEKKLPQIKEWILHEDVSLDQFYRACLFHDIGKLAIPEIIFENTITESRWSELFCNMQDDQKLSAISKHDLEIPRGIQDNPQELLNYFYHENISASRLVPLEHALNAQQTNELLAMGIDTSLPIMEIIETHEEKSEEILNFLGHKKEAVLAGKHHNYKQQHARENDTPASHASLFISTEFASQIIHLADVQQALQTNRIYHLQKPLLKILVFLSIHAQKGLLDPSITALWIDDELRKMRNEMPKYFDDLEAANTHGQMKENTYIASRIHDLNEINTFLKDYLSTFN